MVRFYMDVHIPGPITDGLRRRGVDVLTSQEDGTAQISDAELLDRATHLGRVLFSEDEDLLAEAAKRQTTGVRFGGVIYIHQLNLVIGPCIDDLELIAKAAEAAEYADRVQYLPLR